MEIDPSNFNSKIETYCSENSLDVCDNDIIINMIKSGYSFVNMPPSRIKRGLAEVRIFSTNGNHKESVSIMKSLFKPCPYCQKTEEQEYEEYNMDDKVR